MSHSTSKTMFPHVFDSTMLATLRSCPHKAFRQYMQHWKPKSESVHLVAGGAFAKGIEVAREAFYEQGICQQDAVGKGLEALILAYGDFECPSDSAKSLERMCGALEFYFVSYPLGDDGIPPLKLASGRHAIEFSFAQPLPIVHPVSGDPILFTGRADMAGHYAGGVYLVDEKTTTSLGASWGRQWEMRSQFTGYTWAARENGIPAQGCVVRGVSILKTKYDTLQVVTDRSQYELDRWLEQTCRDIKRLEAMWREDYYDFNLDHACAEYGGCSFVRVCKSKDPETWLPMYFEPRVWDPLARREISVAEWEAEWEGS